MNWKILKVTFVQTNLSKEAAVYNNSALVRRKNMSDQEEERFEYPSPSPTSSSPSCSVCQETLPKVSFYDGLIHF